ncbi:hypothetical protein QTJ16_005795 [Diplocarpon rosae]|uniref:Uncharacterized protein n=1 Tax=Diplocarpon rosae TaxID=946125 RepID=A0AAD9WAR1_9HELO|nr:hypothetical protein QTJ16_005795 [Diplocarpon rosae]
MSEGDADSHSRGAKRPASPSDSLPNSSPKRQQITHNGVKSTENISGELNKRVSGQTFSDLDASGHEDDEEDVAQQLEAENREKKQTDTPEQAQDSLAINRNQGAKPETRSGNGEALLPQTRQQSSSTENTQEQPQTLHQKSPCSLNEEAQPQLRTSPRKAGMPQQVSSEVPGSSLERGPRIAEHRGFPRSSEKSRRNSSAQPVDLYERLSNDLENGSTESDSSERGRNSAKGTKYTPSRTSRQISEGLRTRNESRYRKGVVKQGRTSIQVPKVRSLRLHESDCRKQGQDDQYARQSQARNRQRLARSQLAPGFGDVPFAFNNISDSDDETERPRTPTGGSTLDHGSPLQAETPLQEALRRKPQRPRGSHHETNATVYKATEVLFRKNIFGNISQSKIPNSLNIKPGTPTRLPSGRGLIPDVIDLCTPESAKRPVPMKDRLAPTPVYKKPSPVRAGRPKTLGAPNIPVKKAAKHKDKPRPQPIDSAAFRQQRAAETIVTKEIKGADEALDLAIFGEVIHDQAAEDKKTEEARLAGQLDRENKMASLAAKEEAARLAEEENQRKQQEEIAMRRLEKEKEEEKKRVKRIAERKKQEALELQEKEALRRRAAEKIRADRQKLAEEEKQKEIAKQKASRVEAQHLAQMEAKREAARKQAASLSASRLPPAVLTKPDNSGADELEDDFQSLFVGADDSVGNPATSEAQSTPAKQTDMTGKKAVLNNKAEIFAQANILSAYRAEREVEDAARAAERAKTKMNARYSAKSETSKPDPIRSQRPQVSERPPPVSRPAPAKVSAPKPPPKPKAKPSPKSAAGAKAGSNPQLEGSLSVGTLPVRVQVLLPPAQGLFDNPIAKRWFAGLPDGFSVFGKTKAKPGGPEPREYKQKSKLISEIQHEELEIAAKREKKTAFARNKKSPTDEQKAEIRRKRAEQARKKQTQNIQDLADRNGISLSEEDLKRQVDEFMEQREKRIEKRNETRKLKESQAKENASNEGLRTGRGAVIGTQQAIPLDRSQPGTEVVYSDSETESEEDPDDEPETPLKSPTVTPEAEKPHEVDADSGSESDDTEVGAVPPEKSAPDDTDHSISQMINNPTSHDDRLVFIYQVIKLETESRNEDKETQTHTSQMEGQFVSLDEANALVKLMVSKYREFHTRSLAEWFVGEKLHANIVFDAQHEIKLYIKAYAKPSSLFPVAALAKLPVRFPAQSWIVMAYSERRATNNGVLEFHHDSKRIQQFTVLQMANHAACAHLIELTRPKRPKMDDVVDHNHAAEQMRGARDSADDEGVGFEVEIEGDAAPWLEGTIRVAVEHFDVVGPLN